MDTIEVIKNWIDKKSAVLDLGCGDGEIMNILSKEWGVYCTRSRNKSR